MQDRYVELLHFQLEVMILLETRAYETNDEERIPVIKIWLGWEGLLLMETSTQEEKKNEKPKRDYSQCSAIDLTTSY